MASGPYSARGLAVSFHRASRMLRRSSSARPGGRLVRRPGPALGPLLVLRLGLGPGPTHLRTHRLGRPSASPILSALSPDRRRRTASLRTSASDTWAPRSMEPSNPRPRVERCPAVTPLHQAERCPAGIDLGQRHDVLRFAPERCPAGRHLGSGTCAETSPSCGAWNRPPRQRRSKPPPASTCARWVDCRLPRNGPRARMDRPGRGGRDPHRRAAGGAAGSASTPAQPAAAPASAGRRLSVTTADRIAGRSAVRHSSGIPTLPASDRRAVSREHVHRRSTASALDKVRTRCCTPISLRPMTMWSCCPLRTPSPQLGSIVKSSSRTAACTCS